MWNSAHRWGLVIPGVVLLLLSSSVPASAQSHPMLRAQAFAHCQGYFSGKHPTEEELKQVLDQHLEWLRGGSRKEDPRKANLCRADLSGIRLGADMRGADLSSVLLFDADLSGSFLFGANLKGADLVRTNLQEVVLQAADLSGSDMAGANLSGAKLLGANMDSVNFEPDTLPVIDEIAYARNLSEMFFYNRPQALVKLRKEFKEAGYYRQEKEITYAIKHQETRQLLSERNLIQVRLAALIEGLFNYIFFELTTRWGMVPGRALRILLVLIPIFAIPYVIALHRRQGLTGIWRKWDDNRVRKELGAIEPMRLRLGWRQAFVVGLYFSVLSAFNIGWRELNVGTWIQRLQANEYTLRPTGWVRTVSGAQALISVYMLAIWALTYFGRPFD
jgi:pentapeptide repeat protein